MHPITSFETARGKTIYYSPVLINVRVTVPSDELESVQYDPAGSALTSIVCLVDVRTVFIAC